MDNKEKLRLLIIGLDGGEFSVINPLVEKGELPNIGKIMKQGTSGPLRSTFPPVTGPAWVSFMTGKNPGRHGVFDFMGHAKENFLRRIPVSTRSIRARTLWSILSENGVRLGLINVPITYPPEKIQGFCLPGQQAGLDRDKLSYPEELIQELKEQCGEVLITVPAAREPQKFLEWQKRVLESRAGVGKYLINSREWELFMLVFKCTDTVQHRFWRAIDRSHPGYDSEFARKYGEVINGYYRDCDAHIGDMLRLAESKGKFRVMIISDHGGGGSYYTVGINRWLMSQGFLAVRGMCAPAVRVRPVYMLYRLFFRSGYDAFMNLVDWKRTKAYFGNFTEQGIYINVRGREPFGIVDQGREYQMVRNEIMNKLLEIENPLSGEPLIENVYKKEDIYSGKHLRNAPDIYFSIQDGAFSGREGIAPGPLLKGTGETSGTHRDFGIFMIAGNGIRQDAKITGARITDLAPTILYHFGVPIPAGMDGRVLEECFEERVLKWTKPEFRNEDEDEDEDEEEEKDNDDSDTALTGQDVYSKEEMEKIKKELRGLGYIGE